MNDIAAASREIREERAFREQLAEDAARDAAGQSKVFPGRRTGRTIDDVEAWLGQLAAVATDGRVPVTVRVDDVIRMLADCYPDRVSRAAR